MNRLTTPRRENGNMSQTFDELLSDMAEQERERLFIEDMDRIDADGDIVELKICVPYTDERKAFDKNQILCPKSRRFVMRKTAGTPLIFDRRKTETRERAWNNRTGL